MGHGPLRSGSAALERRAVGRRRVGGPGGAPRPAAAEEAPRLGGSFVGRGAGEVGQPWAD